MALLEVAWPVGVLMPGAWGASARSLPTFLVPDAAAGEAVLVAGEGAVWAAQATEQLRQAARNRMDFMGNS